MMTPEPLIAPAGERPQGISLVTCCKNRNGNLVRAIRSWLIHPEISEIVIVDWDSAIPVARDLANAGISDYRIKVVRVYQEPRWILSYAFNVGFRVARYDQILKCDADIVLDAAYFSQNRLEQGRFIAGNWRLAGDGQQYVNGFFHIHTADLMRVNGFNEYITTYGWDDDDLYERLTFRGVERQDVAVGTVSHLEHDDAARTHGRGVEQEDGWSDLDASTMFKIRTNRFVATIMPRWEPHLPMRPYRINPHSDGTWTVRRMAESVHEVPDHIYERARMLAAYELISWQAGIRTYQLTEEQLDLLLSSHRLKQISALLIELTLGGASMAAMTMQRVLVVNLHDEIGRAGQAAIEEAGERLARMAYRSGRLLVVSGPDTRPPLGLSGVLANAPYVPAHVPLGDMREVGFDEVRRDGMTMALRVFLDEGGLGSLPDTPEIVSDEAADWVRQSLPPAPHPVFDGRMPAIRTSGRARLFIDAQHGLGNRLRAIGSADAVARATDRDLVVVWEPDHHCDCRMEDLFDYPGTVVSKSFLPQAAADGCIVLNYMEIEADAAKGAPLELEPARDAYVRSAYVLNHPASDWHSDNILLRQLQPVAAVQALLDRAGPAAEIGVHVRMEGAPGSDHNSYDARENWTAEGHAAIHHWRSKSHYAAFMTRLDALLAAKPGTSVFLAADQATTYQAFRDRYGETVNLLERQLYDRSTEQLQYALADMLALARTKHLLGSNWSSFTEAALRLSSSIKRHEISGKDF